MSKSGPSQPRRKPRSLKAKSHKSPKEEGGKAMSENDMIEAELARDAAARAEAEAAANPDQDSKPTEKPAPGKAKAEVVSVNQRQIASDTLSLSGDGASDFIARISDFLQANGKIIVTVLLVAVVAAVFLFVTEAQATAELGEWKATVARASSPDSELRGRKRVKAITESFEALQPGDEAWKQAEYWYQYSEAFFGAMLSARSQDAKKLDHKDIAEDNAAIFEKFNNYREVVNANPDADPDSTLRLKTLEGYQLQLERDETFRMSKDSRFSDHTGYWKSEEGSALTETKMIPADVVTVEEGNPVIAFDTSKGLYKVRLFEITRNPDTDESKDEESRARFVRGERKSLQNSVGLFVTLVERGYYDGQNFDGVTVPGAASWDEPALATSHHLEFGRRGMLKRKPKPDESEEDAADAPEKEVRNPDFTVLPERLSTLKGVEGAVFQLWDLKNPNLRGTRFGINLKEGANNMIAENFQVVGQVVEGLEVCRSLTRSDVIYKAWMVQKRQDTQDETGYLPRVLFMSEGNRAKGKNEIPQVWTDEEPEFIAPRVEKADLVTIKKADDGSFVAAGEYNSNRTIVVLSTPRGDVVVELFDDQAPNTVKNFVYLIQNKLDFFKETTFSYDEDKQQVVGGNPVGSDIGYTIASESREEGYSLRNVATTLSMEYDGSNIDGASTKFVINLDDNDSRDGKPEGSEKDKAGYTVFGRVIKNFWALESIEALDRLDDAWVVQVREGVEYDPMVRQTGDAEEKKASSIKDEDE